MDESLTIPPVGFDGYSSEGSEGDDDAMDIDPGPIWTPEQHALQDDRVRADLRLELYGGWREELTNYFMTHLVIVLVSIVNNTKVITLEKGKAYEYLKDDKELQKLVRDTALEGRGFSRVREDPRLGLRQLLPPSSKQLSAKVIIAAQMNATTISWNAPYKGDAVVGLQDHIRRHWQKEKIYANYLSITQSSGCGKSRLVDEYSKNYFTIPMNLRKPNHTGYPASDEVLYNYFTDMPLIDEADVSRHIASFLIALFKTCLSTLKGPDAPPNCRDYPLWFRGKMTEDQATTSVNKFRRHFYQQVVKCAGENYIGLRETGEKKSSRFLDSDEYSVVHHARALSYALVGKVYGAATSKQWSSDNFPDALQEDFPTFTVAVDEASSLLRDGQSQAMSASMAAQDGSVSVYTAWTLWSVFRRGLQTFRSEPGFTLFLSTTGSISQLHPVKDQDPSARIVEGTPELIPPYCVLGFDQLAKELPEHVQLDHVANLGYQASLGRPLFASHWQAALAQSKDERVLVQSEIVRFAQAKLLCRPPQFEMDKPLAIHEKLACLSQRLPIEFATTHGSPSAAEKDQVANHMRVCLSISPSFSAMITLNPSEAILASAAAMLMIRTDRFDAPAAMREVIRGFAVDPSHKGEFINMLLVILARDKTLELEKGLDDTDTFYVVPFLRNLLCVRNGRRWDVLRAKPAVYRESKMKNRTLQTAFKHTMLHFNHFIRRSQTGGFTTELLKGLLCRNAGLAGANSQPGIDAMLVTVDGIGPKSRPTAVRLTEDTMGLILLQTKLNSRYSINIHHELFDAMDPVTLGIVKATDHLSIPIIRIVFALGGKTSGIKVVDTQRQGNFTSYDIWVSGLSSDVYSIVNLADEQKWLDLRSYVYNWQDKYQDSSKTISNMMMNMTPLAADDEPFSSFLKGAKPGP